MFAALGVLLLALIAVDTSVWTPAEQLVRVYRRHGCTCAFQWKKDLEQAGYTVVLREVETLRYLRRQRDVPRQYSGCHLGVYLGYFVEGHVDPASLKSLATLRPRAKGLIQEEDRQPGSSAQASSATSSHLLLAMPDGRTVPWSAPSSAPGHGV